MCWDVCSFIHICCLASETVVDNEFTQLMKGLQGERLRQAFHYLDKDEDGFIRPEEFKRIIMVCYK
jgi:Ca2+-binding EF-hand superfamily protein